MHILTHTPGDERHSYRLSIDSSIIAGPCLLVSKPGVSFMGTPKTVKICPFCPFRDFDVKTRNFRPLKESVSILSHQVVCSGMLVIQLVDIIIVFFDPGARGSMCTHQAHPHIFIGWRHTFLSPFGTIFLGVPIQNGHGCAFWVHILSPAPGDEKPIIISTKCSTNIPKHTT